LELILGADAVISTVNVPAFEDQYLFVDAAIEAGYTSRREDTDNRVKRFFPSEFGSNSNLPDIASIPYLKPKVKFAHYVEDKAKQGLIEYTLVNTGAPNTERKLIIGGLAEYAIKTEFYGINFKDRTFHRRRKEIKYIHFPPRRRKIRRGNPKTSRTHQKRRHPRSMAGKFKISLVVVKLT